MNKYDVSRLLKEGKNVFVAEIGNGLYNEGATNVWGFEKAQWKGEKQLIASLFIDGKEVFSTDESWKSISNDFYLYNDLRIGESVDFNNYNPNLYLNDVIGFNGVITTNHLMDSKFTLNYCPSIKEYHN